MLLVIAPVIAPAVSIGRGIICDIDRVFEKIIFAYEAQGFRRIFYINREPVVIECILEYLVIDALSLDINAVSIVIKIIVLDQAVGIIIQLNAR